MDDKERENHIIVSLASFVSQKVKTKKDKVH